VTDALSLQDRSAGAGLRAASEGNAWLGCSGETRMATASPGAPKGSGDLVEDT
jgi:hypothetical protein